MPQRVLLIEDDHDLGRQIVERLRRAGYDALWWTQGRELESTRVPEVDLVVLDLMLPGVPGFELLEQLRSRSEVPVLVLSARNDTGDKIRALKLGADDYMTKPFWPEELLERVKARLRRPALQRDDGIRVGGLLIDPSARQVRLDGQLVALTPVELDILLVLARRRGMAVTRKQLADQVLGAADDRALDAHVSRVRKKLAPRKVIETVWGIGYRIAEDDG
ncbi:MAG: response regulator transcription factor [Nannocystaceae bacterium]|nr:response regulator transcription factor [Nannocystaceae bacterium]